MRPVRIVFDLHDHQIEVTSDPESFSWKVSSGIRADEVKLVNPRPVAGKDGMVRWSVVDLDERQGTLTFRNKHRRGDAHWRVSKLPSCEYIDDGVI